MIAVFMLLLITTAYASEKNLNNTYFQELGQKEISAHIAMLVAANDIRERYTEKDNYYLQNNSLYRKTNNTCVAQGPFYLFEPSITKFHVGKGHLILLKKELIYGIGSRQEFMVYDKNTKEHLETIDPFDNATPDIKSFLHTFAVVQAFTISPDMHNFFLAFTIPAATLSLTESCFFVWLKKNSYNQWFEHLSENIPPKNYEHLDFFHHLLAKTGEPNHIALLEKSETESAQGNITIHQLGREKLPLLSLEEYLEKKQ
jgi:hypothetical protein